MVYGITEIISKTLKSIFDLKKNSSNKDYYILKNRR